MEGFPTYHHGGHVVLVPVPTGPVRSLYLIFVDALQVEFRARFGGQQEWDDHVERFVLRLSHVVVHVPPDRVRHRNKGNVKGHQRVQLQGCSDASEHLIKASRRQRLQVIFVGGVVPRGQPLQIRLPPCFGALQVPLFPT